LAPLYAAPIGQHLVFKGGASLSKAYNVIRRFSEDVDLIYDIRALAPDLVGETGDALPKTRTEERRWSGAIRRRLPGWVAEAVQPVIAKALSVEGLAASIRVEGEKLFIDYETMSPGSGYVAPSVMLEFGARSTGEPASLRDVVCEAAGLIDGVTFPAAQPRVMDAERTFWEKATASRDTGTMWLAWTMLALQKPPSSIANLRKLSPAISPCSSQRGPPSAHL
jgi:hypothetical protein